MKEMSGSIVSTLIVVAVLLVNMNAAIPQSTTSNGLQCQRITIPACQGLGYNMTAMPNLAGHTNQLEAELHINKLMPLIESNCSSRARFLLCSSLFPLCTPDVPRPVTSCKSLCETVREECRTNVELMQLWPEFLNCATLPQPEKYKLCMQIPQEQQSQQLDQKTNLNETTLQQQQQQQQPLSSSSIATPPLQIQQLQIPNLNQQQQQQQSVVPQLTPQQQPMMQTPPTQQQQQPPQHINWPWIYSWKYGKTLNGVTAQQHNSQIAPRNCPTNFTVSRSDDNRCSPQCNKDAFFTTQEKKHAESLILGLSAVCFVLTLFSLVTFWAEPMRFSYPERPVLYLCLCYNLLSVCYLERIIFHNSQRTFAAMEMRDTSVSHASHREPMLPCTLTSPCLASYITTSYLSLAGATWWLIFSVCFYLSSHKKWSSEALEQRSGLFHVLAWVPALVPPIAALLLERVQFKELTGMCSARGFMELPALVLLLLGLFFTLRTTRSLYLLQQQLQPAFGQQRFAQIRKRFLVFSLVFFLPTLGSVIASVFERYYATVPVCPDGSASCKLRHEDEQSAWPELIRIFLQLAGGSLTGMWVWSRKTCESYRNRLVATPTSTTSTCKSMYALPKKYFYESDVKVSNNSHKVAAPLYSGINFHNVPVIYNPHQQHV